MRKHVSSVLESERNNGEAARDLLDSRTRLLDVHGVVDARLSELVLSPAMTRKDLNHYVLSTGREFYAHLGIIGCADQANQEYQDGNVGTFFTAYGFDSDLALDEWTQAERVELADFMIDQWQRFKAGDGGEDCEAERDRLKKKVAELERGARLRRVDEGGW